MTTTASETSAPPPFKIWIADMRSSGGQDFYLILDRSDRPEATQPWDKRGRVTPFKSKFLENVHWEAQTWAEFLGVDPPLQESVTVTASPEPLSLSRVVCAAIRNGEGRIITGARHYDRLMREQIEYQGKWHWVGRSTESGDRWVTQGFVDQFGNFLTRREAYQVALTRGQIKRQVGGTPELLTSEMLY
jgi:hypothetical protein